MPPSRVLERERLMRKLFLPAVACTLWLMFTGSAAAADIVYPVNFSVDGGSVSGTITTDGFLGPLFTVDIVSFDLTLTDPTPATATLIDPGNASVFLGGGALVATATTLTFNFNQGAFANFTSTDTGCQPLLSLRGAGGSLCNGTSGTLVEIAAASGPPGAVSGTPATALFTPGGEFPLEEVPAPEPASLGMILVGLVGVISLLRLSK
jgi:hypothetical protein